MKKFALIIAVVVSLFVFNAQARGCPSYQLYTVHIQQANGQYVFYKNYIDANQLIADIQNNPSVSGRVQAQDSCTDAYHFWQFANGSWWRVR